MKGIKQYLASLILLTIATQNKTQVKFFEYTLFWTTYHLLTQ